MSIVSSLSLNAPLNCLIQTIILEGLPQDNTYFLIINGNKVLQAKTDGLALRFDFTQDRRRTIMLNYLIKTHVKSDEPKLVNRLDYIRLDGLPNVKIVTSAHLSESTYNIKLVGLFYNSDWSYDIVNTEVQKE